MLALSRLVDERIRIKLEDGRVIWITVIDTERTKVRLGIDADKSIEILREELIPLEERYAPKHRRPENRDDRPSKAKTPDSEFGVFIDRLDAS